MYAHQIDKALDAILACMVRVPELRDCYRESAPERAALDDLLAALKAVDAVLFARATTAPKAIGSLQSPFVPR